MKTKAIHKFYPNTRKVCSAFLVSCILLSSCGKPAGNPDQNFTQPPTTTAPQSTPTTTLEPSSSSTPNLTPTLEPEPNLANTPIPTPTATPTPEPNLAMDFTFLPRPYEPDKTSLLDYMSQEEIDAAFSLSYDPDSDMQLYARYQGWLKSSGNNYCIDLIQTDNSIGKLLINIKIYSGSIRYLKSGDSHILQNVYYYIDPSPQLDASKEVLQIMDINNDGYDDFVFDLGLTGNKNKYSLAFVYDIENNIYALLGHFYTATYLPEGQTIWEQNNNPMGYPSKNCKYLVIGTEAILMESIEHLDNLYTYQKRIDGELVTILEDVAYEELCGIIGDFSTWCTIPISIE